MLGERVFPFGLVPFCRLDQGPDGENSGRQSPGGNSHARDRDQAHPHVSGKQRV